MKTYIPSESELVEMGFKYQEWLGLKFYKKNLGYDELQFHLNDASWSLCGTIYPRSKEHLESIILAFKKP